MPITKIYKIMCDHVFQKVSKNADYLRIQEIIHNAVREQPWDDRLSPEESLTATVEAMRRLGYRLITPVEYMSKSKLSSNIPLWILEKDGNNSENSSAGNDTMNMDEPVFSMDDDFQGDAVALRTHSLKESPTSIASDTTATLINTQLATEEWPRADLLKY